MSLKDLISTLIESAFTNKKGFIADNASPATSEIDNRVRTSISDLFLRQEGITSLNATEVCHA